MLGGEDGEIIPLRATENLEQIDHQGFKLRFKPLHSGTNHGPSIESILNSLKYKGIEKQLPILDSIDEALQSLSKYQQESLVYSIQDVVKAGSSQFKHEFTTIFSESTHFELLYSRIEQIVSRLEKEQGISQSKPLHKKHLKKESMTPFSAFEMTRRPIKISQRNEELKPVREEVEVEKKTKVANQSSQAIKEDELYCSASKPSVPNINELLLMDIKNC